MTRTATLGVLAVSFLAGCSSLPPVTPTPDAGPIVDAGVAADAGTCGAHTIPTSNFGSLVGRSVADFTLNDCTGQPYSFYGDDYCAATLTVFMIEAGWCHPSNVDADALESMLVMPYASRGVRVIQILIADDDFHAPTAPGFCAAWMARTNPQSLSYQTPASAAMHALSASDHVTLLDPDGTTAIYDPGDMIPAITIVDGDGVIRERLTGPGADASSPLAEITQCVDLLLSGMPCH